MFALEDNGWNHRGNTLAPGGRECVQPENLSMSQSWYHAAIFPTGEVVTTINKSGYIKIGCLTQFLLANTVSWLGVGGKGDTVGVELTLQEAFPHQLGLLGRQQHKPLSLPLTHHHHHHRGLGPPQKG